MFKRIEQKIKDADYERDMQEVLEILNDKREQHLQSRGLIPKQSNEPNDSAYTEKQVKTSNCRLCKMDFKGTQGALNKHLESDIHQKNLKAYKQRYGDYLYIIKRSIFKNRHPKHHPLGKLKFFRLAYQYE